MGSPCLFTRQQALKLGYFTGCAFKIRIHFSQNEVVVTWNTQNFILNIMLLLFK